MNNYINIINYNIDKKSGFIKNSIEAAIFHAQEWLYIKFLKGENKRGISQYYYNNN